MNVALHSVAITGAYNTEQARDLGRSTRDVLNEAALGAIADAGLTPADIDAVVATPSAQLVFDLGLGTTRTMSSGPDIEGILEAAGLLLTGEATAVLLAAAKASSFDRSSVAPWVRPANEFVVSHGLITPAEFAFMARRHMIEHGTTAEQMATVAAQIRNNGHANPEAIYHGKGPFTVDDILASPMVADPFHLLECATTSQGGCAVVMTLADRSADAANAPIWLLGGGSDRIGPSYQTSPSWDRVGFHGDDTVAGYIGRRAAQRAFGQAGINPADVDVCEFYDPFSFEIIRQFEAFGFCGDGEGGEFVMDGRIALSGEFPITTDGGLMSYSHAGSFPQQLQRVIRGVDQLRGTCAANQVDGAEIAIASNGGSGALYTEVLLMGSAPAT
ncbi:MAG: thiolase family protein [Acidimicrobiales bacterium]|jgi:acetyl-CoA acetyltransferase|nr:thiolase family protein [Acidimicrobiales bacterium]